MAKETFKFLVLFFSFLALNILIFTLVFSQKPSLEISPQAPPIIQDATVTPPIASQGQIFIINCKISDVSGVSSAVAFFQHPDETNIAVLPLYDDGLHNDALANDEIYGNSWNSTGASPGLYFVDISATDILGFSTSSENATNFKVTLPGCSITCPTKAGCKSVPPSNSHITGDECCVAGEECYECNAGYCWNGIDCILDVTPVAQGRVGKAPNPTSTSVTVINGETVYFDGSSSSDSGGGEITKYEWDFEGDGIFDWIGSFGSAGMATHIYTFPNTYHPILRVTDNCGRTNTTSVTVIVNPASISVTIKSPLNDIAFAHGDPVAFNCQVTGGTPPYSYIWESDKDGIIGNSQSFSKSDLTNSTDTITTHLITLTVTDSMAQTATDSVVIHIPPDSWDWRDVNGENWMTPVKDQGFCDASWAFATLGSIEAKYKIEKGNSALSPDLSEQYLISDCCVFGDCTGGNPAFPFLIMPGTPSESCYPYIGGNSPCPSNCNDGSEIKFWRTNQEKLVVPTLFNNKGELQYALIKHGPLYVEVDILGGATGNLDAQGCSIQKCSNPSNHAMVLVGYNNSGGYWILKNSWGTIDPCLEYVSLDYNTCLTGLNMKGIYGEGITAPFP